MTIRTSNNPRRTLFLVALVAALCICWYLTPTSTVGLFQNSLKLALLSGLVALPLSSLLAFFMARFEIPGRRFIDGCLLVLLLMPLYVQLAAWEAGFGRGGWYSTLIAEQLSDPPLEGLRGSVWVHAMAAIPWLYGVFRLGLESIPSTYEDAARIDGSAWQVFRHVTLPLTLPVFVGGALFVGIVTMTEITVTDRYQFRSYAEVIYSEFALGFDKLPVEIASVPLNLAMLVLVGLSFCVLTGGRLVHATPNSRRQRLKTTQPWPFAFVIVMIMMLLGVPLANLLYQAGIEVEQIGDQRHRVWSFSKCVSLIAKSPISYQEELAWTAVLSQLSILSSISIATLWAWWSHGRKIRQWIGLVICVICFATPGTLISLAIMRTLNHPNSLMIWLYDDTLAAPWLALTIKCLPFACLLLWQGMRTIPQSVLDAARIDGASSISTFWRIVLPLLRPNIICAALICLAVSIGELSASLLVLPPSVTTVSKRIFSLIHYGAEDQLAGLCLSCVIVMMCLSWATRAAIGGLSRSQL